MIKGKDKVLNFVRTNDAAYWTIYEYKGSRTHCIFKSSQDPNLSLDLSIEKLESDLLLLESGRYMISCKQKAEDTKNLREIAFDYTNNEATAIPSHQSNPQPVQGISLDELDRRLRDHEDRIYDRIERENLKKQNEELQKRVKELEGNTMDAAISGIAARLDPYVEPILSHFFPQQQPVSVGVKGLPNSTAKPKPTPMAQPVNTNTEITAEEATKRVQDALSMWQDAAPDTMIQVIEMIAQTAKNEPAKYNMYAQMLLSK